MTTDTDCRKRKSKTEELRLAFVKGAKWWEWTKEGATMWQSDQGLARKRAEELFPSPKRRKKAKV